MRTRKAFIAGFGTTGALMAATVCMFAVVSAIVAFEGWPDLSIGRSATTLDDGGALGSAAAGDAALGLGGPATRHDGRSRRSLAGRAVRGAGTPGIVVGEERGGVKGVAGAGGAGASAPEPATAQPAARGSAQGGAGASSGGDPAPAAPAGSSAPSPSDGGTDQTGDGAVVEVTSGLGTTVAQTGTALGTAVATTTGQLGATVGQVSPALGQTVVQTGQAVGSTVSGTTGAASQVVVGAGAVVGGLLGGLGGGTSTSSR